MKYATKGTCSREINFEVVDGKLHNVGFVGGCNGNLQGIGRLVDGNTRSHRQTERHQVWFQVDVLPRSTCLRIGRISQQAITCNAAVFDFSLLEVYFGVG